MDLPKPITTWLTLLLLCLRALGAGQSPAGPEVNTLHGSLHGWRFRSWETTPERPDSSATAMAQDEAGYLWFGSFNGLIRFDGERMVGHWHLTEPGLPDDGVVNLFKDRLNRIWVSTYGGLTVIGPTGRLDPRGFEAGWPAGQFVRSWYETVDGTLHVVTFQRDVLRFRNGAWETLPRVPEPDHAGIHLAESAEGRLIALRQGAAHELVAGAWTSTTFPVGTRERPVAGTCVARGGGRWYFDGVRLSHRRDGREVSSRTLPDWEGTVWSMTEDSEGAVWLCSNISGLHRSGPDGRFDRFDRAAGFPVDDVRFVFEDRQGVHWVGTSGGGLIRLLRSVVDGLGTRHGLEKLSVQALLPEPDGTVLTAVQGGGIYRWDGTRFSRPTEDRWAPFLRENVFVTSLVRKRDGDHWVGGNNGLIFELGAGGLSRHQPVPTSGRYENRIELFADASDRVWAGFNDVLMVHRDGEWRAAGDEALRPAEVRSFAQSPKGGPVFAGSRRRGLFVLEDENRIRRYGAAEGLPSDSVRALCLDRTGTLWIATDRGLARLRNGVVKAVSPTRPFAPEGIVRMLEDGRRRLWISAAGGLLNLSIDDLDAACDGNVDCLPHRWYTRQDGIPFSEFPPAAAALPDGTLWFGTIRGVASVNPSRVVGDRRQLGLTIEEVQWVDSKGHDRIHPFPTGGGIRRIELPRGSRRIRIRYAAFDTAAPHQIGFEYRIEGVDREWVDQGGTREVEFASLPPGIVTLAVRAVSAGGIVDPIEARLVLAVEPAFWEERWFQAGVLLTLGLFAAGVAARFENRRLARRREDLAHEEAALKERAASMQRELLFRRLIDQSRDGIYVLDPRDGRFLDANESAALMVGYTREELLRLHATDIAATDRPLDWSRQNERLRSEGRLAFESHQRRRDGTLLPIEVELANTTIQGGEYVIAFVRDISERLASRERQAALEHQLREAQKMEAIGCLAGGVAHDFNNLLQAIGGFAELARLDVTPRERDEHLSEIGRTVGRATQLTRQLLAFSRKHEVEMRRIRLNELIENSSRLLGRLLGADIRIAVSGAPGLPDVLGDAGLIDQILLNLAVNARDAMPSGGRLEIATGEVVFRPGECPAWARPGHFVRLSVRDTGCGMEPAVLDRIFEPFFTTKPQGKGTGLGLSVVYGNVQQHDGFVRVVSAPGRGTLFEVHFPALPPGDSGNPSDTEILRAPGRGSILFCDDEPGIRKAGRIILEGAGYTVIAVGSGEEAVQTVRAHPELFSLAILDVMMPGMSGTDAAAAIRKVVPGIPVLFITGFSGASIPPAAQREPGTALLRKPYTRTELVAEVERILGRPVRHADPARPGA